VADILTETDLLRRVAWADDRVTPDVDVPVSHPSGRVIMTCAVARGIAPPEFEALTDSLAIDMIRRHLVTEAVGCRIYLFRDVGSTNEVLRRLARSGAREGTVVLAEAQTAGRGRCGQAWFSPPGVNLYASVLLRPPIPRTAVPVFSFIASLALTDAIWAQGVRAGIKWPNDVVVDGLKVGGTLVSYADAGDRVEYVILGVGLNLNVDRASLRAALGSAAAGATSVAAAAGRRIDRNAFAAAFLNFVEKWAAVYRTRGAAAVLQAWRERDVLTGRWATIDAGDGPLDACVVGVDDDGCLQIQDCGGRRRSVASATVAPRARGAAVVAPAAEGAVS
jgi:BirA family biotin operon repressor/biotin-[acetyl-CoA-carboxylase] ligase